VFYPKVYKFDYYIALVIGKVRLTKAEVLKYLRSIPTGNIQENQQILAEALIFILEHPEEVRFT
jgi:hypothetical protein